MAGRGIDEKLRCSFCNKTQDQVKKLISGPNGIYICDQCVSICSDILDEEFEEEDDGNPAEDMEINLLKPKEIKEFLDSYVMEFLDLPNEFHENDLRKALIRNMKDFIL